MNTQLTKFFSGLTKADISNKFYNTTSNAYIEEVIFEEEVCPYIEALNTHIDNRVEEIDKEFNYRTHKLEQAFKEDVVLTSWVKGGRI